jgi:AP-3 complex subunit beta
MLTRYARTQFVDPNRGDGGEEEDEQADGDFYENSDDETILSKRIKLKMDQDHRLLLRCAKPLLQSRNASVIMAVAQLFHHCAPKAEVQVVAKAMIRLLRSHREVQAIVLNCIASMTSARSRNKMFDQFLRNFFIRSSDPTHIKILKLEIMTNMATEANIGMILREFQSYITSQVRLTFSRRSHDIFIERASAG